MLRKHSDNHLACLRKMAVRVECADDTGPHQDYDICAILHSVLLVRYSKCLK